MENASSLGYFICLHLASMDVKYHSESKSEPKPFLPQKHLYLCVHYFVMRSWERLGPGRQTDLGIACMGSGSSSNDLESIQVETNHFSI